MLDESLYPKIEAFLTRYEEIRTLLADPAVLADQRRYVKLNKEYKQLEAMVNAWNARTEASGNLEFADEVLSAGGDEAEMESAREMRDTARADIDRLDDEIKLLLLPADPEDDKNAAIDNKSS